MPLDVHNFVNTPEEFQGIYHLADTLQRNKERQYQIDQQNKKDQEADQWKKLNLIQDLTDLSKHQTGSDIANALGNKQASEIFQKYTLAADKMSPMELQANIQRDMSGAIQGMDATKNELDAADKQISQVKSEFPDLNIAQLHQDARTDILHRRLDNNGGFANPLTVPQSNMNLADPELLSKYVTGNKNLKDYFQNPQGLDDSHVYEGNSNNYTKFTAKIPPWKKPNFSPEDLTNGTFLNKGVTPQLQFKSSTLPSDALPASKDKPFEMMDKDVYDNLGGKQKVELVASTRNEFPGYDQMNQTEKEYAQRHVLLKTAKAFDQTDFHPTEVHSPSASLLKFYPGQSGDKALAVNDVYHDIDVTMAENEKNGQTFTPVSLLKQSSKDVVLQTARNATGDKTISQDDLRLVRGNDGTLRVFNKKNDFVTYLDRQGSNLKAKQPGVGEKREINKEGNPAQTTPKSTKKDPLGILD